MHWKIDISEKADESLHELDSVIRKRLLKFIFDVLPTLENPRSKGEPLHGVLSKYWKYVIGDYRIIVEIIDKEILIAVIDAGHRSKIYKQK